MARAVPEEVARRRRERLAALLEALGAARGAKVTQREFAASISREQGTVAAILGGHRALGGDVMLAIVQAYKLPVDYFDGALRPDPRPYARAAASTALAPAVPPGARGRRDEVVSSDPALAETLASLRPDRAVAMALERLAQKGAELDADGWARLAIAAQSAHDRGVLVEFYDATLKKHARADEPRGPVARPGPAAPQRALPLAPRSPRKLGSS